MASVGYATLDIIPSLRGIQAAIEKGLVAPATAAGEKSGEHLSRGMTTSVARRGHGVGHALARGVGLGFAALGVASVVKSSVQLEASFSKTLSQIAIATGAPKSAMKGLHDTALRMGAQTSFSANEAADAMLELGKSGISTRDIMKGGLKGTLTLAAAGSLQLGEAAGIASNAMNVFHLRGRDMGKIAAALAGGANASTASVQSLGQALGQVGPGARNAGLSLQETVGVLSAFDQAGIKGSDAGTSLKTMLTRLVPSTDTASAAMKKYGLNFVDAKGNIDGVTTVAQKLKDHLGPLSEAQRTQALATIFGSDSARAASVLMDQGAKGIKKYIDATKDQSAAQKLAAANMSGTAGALDRLGGAVETAKLALGEALAPTVRKLAGYLSGTAVPAFTKFVSQMQTGKGAGGRLATVLGHVKDNVTSFFHQMKTGDGFGGRFASGLDTIRAAAGKALDVAGKLVAAFDGLPSGLKKAIGIGAAAAFVIPRLAPGGKTATGVAGGLAASVVRGIGLEVGRNVAVAIAGKIFSNVQKVFVTNPGFGKNGGGKGGSPSKTEEAAKFAPAAASIAASAGPWGIAAAAGLAATLAGYKLNFGADDKGKKPSPGGGGRVGDWARDAVSNIDLGPAVKKVGEFNDVVLAMQRGTPAAFGKVAKGAKNVGSALKVMADPGAFKKLAYGADQTSTFGDALNKTTSAVVQAALGQPALISGLFKSGAAFTSTGLSAKEYQAKLTTLPTNVQTAISAPGVVTTKADVTRLAKQYKLTPPQVRTLVQLVGQNNAKAAVKSLTKQYHLTPAKVRTLVSQAGADPSKAKVAALARQYHLTPAKVRTLLEAVDKASSPAKRAKAAGDRFKGAYKAFLQASDQGGPKAEAARKKALAYAKVYKAALKADNQTGAGVGAARGTINSLHDRTVTLTTNVVKNYITHHTDSGGARNDTGPYTGGLIRGGTGGYGKSFYSRGGPVWGAGTATSDSIPAYLSDGEYVMRAAAVDKYGPKFMQRVNQLKLANGGLAQGFATGGKPRTIRQQTRAADKAYNLSGDLDTSGIRQEFAELRKAFRLGRSAFKGYEKQVIRSAHALSQNTAKLEEQKQTLDTLKSDQKAYGESVTAAFTHDAFGNGAAGLYTQLTADQNDQTAALSYAGTLETLGISKPLEQALLASGDLTTLSQLAAMTSAQIDQYDALYASQQQAGSDLGTHAGDVAFGDQITAQSALIKSTQATMAALKKQIEGIEKAVERGAARGFADRTRKAHQHRRANR